MPAKAGWFQGDEFSMGVSKTGAGRATTIVDIARAAGVSKSTVSYVLKGSPLVKAGTRARVEAIIEQYGYIYNRSAASLRTATSTFVGMVISDLTNPFFAELAAGIEDALYKSGYVPMLANTNEDIQRQAQVLRSMREHSVAGIVMSPARGTDCEALSAMLPALVPTVIVMRRVIGSPLAYVGQDNREGARLGVAHLIRLGHRRIAFLGASQTITTRQERIAGWQDAHEEAGLRADPDLIFESQPTREGGKICVLNALEARPTPTAFFCYNDIIAMGASRALTNRGIRVGQDVGVVGFDDIAEAEHNAPPLTTISCDTRQLGALGAESLISMLQGQAPSNHALTTPARLIARESCGAWQSDDVSLLSGRQRSGRPFAMGVAGQGS